ncbi:hypothetical protein D9M70_613590 [compost metagenome]
MPTPTAPEKTVSAVRSIPVADSAIAPAKPISTILTNLLISTLKDGVSSADRWIQCAETLPNSTASQISADESTTAFRTSSSDRRTAPRLTATPSRVVRITRSSPTA